jgi:hypothetical protein
MEGRHDGGAKLPEAAFLSADGLPLGVSVDAVGMER